MAGVTALPTTYEVARLLLNEVLTHMNHYRLRHRCVIKVTTKDVRQLLINEGLIPNGLSQMFLASFTGHVFIHFDYMMEKLGFRLVEKRATKYTTVRYYAIPNCPG